jgi:CheY-like chemotaxis protein
MPKRLLLADDSLTIHRVVELTFADEDFEVISVSNGNQAIEKINSATPDIVIADVNMPEKDGYEVCAFIKNTPQFASIPVLLLKGTFEPFNQEKADSVRADGIIQKPFQSQTLIDKVNNILGLTSSRRPHLPGKTAERIQSEKITQPQPPFMPKPTPPTTPIKDFMPFSHPQTPPQQAPRPKPVPVPGMSGNQMPPTPVSRPPLGVSPLGMPETSPFKENLKPQPVPPPHAHPIAPKIPPYPMQPQTTVSGPGTMKPQAPPPGPGILRPPQPVSPVVPTMPETDDSPFGISAPPQANRYVPAPSSGNELSKDAFEAGKEIYQTFGEPAEDSEQFKPQPDHVKDELVTEGQERNQNEYIVEAQETIPSEIPKPQMPPKKGGKLPDFSDALSDVSMAFNNMQRPDLKPEGYSPFEENVPSNNQPAIQETAQDQWDVSIQPETSGAGEIMFTPEAFESERESTFTPSEIEMPLDQDQSPAVVAESEAVEMQQDFDQFNISSPSEEKLQVSMDKPETMSVPVGIDQKPKQPSEMPQPKRAEMNEEAVSSTDIDVLADKVAAKIAEKISTEAIKEIAWELVPGILEKALRDKLNKS